MAGEQQDVDPYFGGRDGWQDRLPRSGGSRVDPRNEYSDAFLNPDTEAPTGGLYGDWMGYTGLNAFDEDVYDTADYYRNMGGWNDLDAMNAQGWYDYGYGGPNEFERQNLGMFGDYGQGYGRYEGGLNDIYNSMFLPGQYDRRLEGMYNQMGGMGAYDPNALSAIQRASGEGNFGQSWDPYGMGWNEYDYGTAQMADQYATGQGWTDDVRRSILDKMNDGMTPGEAQVAQNIENYRTGPGAYENQRADVAAQLGSGQSGKFESQQLDMANRMSGNAYRGQSWDPWNMGWSQREADTARQWDVFGYDPGKYQGQREQAFSDFAAGRGGYDQKTQDALRQSAMNPIQQQSAAGEAEAQRAAAIRGNSAGLAGAMMRNKLNTGNALSQANAQTQLQIEGARRADRDLGLQGLGQLQGEEYSKQAQALQGRREMENSARDREAQAAQVYGQMGGQADSRLNAAANQYGQLAADAAQRSQWATGQQRGIQESARARAQQAFQGYGQMQGEADQRMQTGLGYRQGASGAANQRAQQAVQNYQNQQGALDARINRAAAGYEGLAGTQDQRRAQAAAGYQALQGDADQRRLQELNYRQGLGQQLRGQQQQALQAGERAGERYNQNVLAGTNMVQNLANRSTQGGLARNQGLMDLLNQQTGRAQGLDTLLSALGSLQTYNSTSSSGGGSGLSFSI